jgi:anti-anti-sigma factor
MRQPAPRLVPARRRRCGPALPEEDERPVDDQAPADAGAARTTVITLPAEIEYRTAGQVHEDLVIAIEPDVAIAIIDLTSTQFCDSAGLGQIVLAYRWACAHHTDLRVVMPPCSPLTRIFSLKGLDRVLSIYPTLCAALAGGPPPGPPAGGPRPPAGNGQPARLAAQATPPGPGSGRPPGPGSGRPPGPGSGRPPGPGSGRPP